MSAGFEDDPEFNEAMPKPRSRRGFTLVELLLVVAIIAVLIALLLPATRSVGPAGRRAQCTSNLKQIAVALHNYEEAHKALPPGYTVDVNGRPLHSWRTLILPYLEQALYRTIDLSKPWNDPANAQALGTSVPVYRCPEARGRRTIRPTWPSWLRMDA
jgi:prepilin-type N-terminal cleavage/methylation domain-containing protein